MRVRRKPAESGTCHADLCHEIVKADRNPTVDGEITVRAFCPEHCTERDLELSVRNASGGTADVVYLDDYRAGGRSATGGRHDGIVD